MVLANAIQARGLAPGLLVVGREPAQQRSRGLAALSFNAGSSFNAIRSACETQCRECSPQPGIAAIRGAVSKQKKKAKERKRSSTSEKQWHFDELMLVWDDVFQKASDNPSVATQLYELSRNGLSQFGRGCVLLQESVNTRPRGAASGFSFKSRRSSVSSPELPFYTSGQWVAEYVPKDFILDPSKAPIVAPDGPDTSVGDDEVRVVGQGKLLSVLRAIDKTRLVGITSDPESEDYAGTTDVGGEVPYDPANDELVILLVVVVDGQRAVGADILKAYPTIDDGINTSMANLWTLTLRDNLPN